MPQLRKWVGKVFHVHGKDATIRWDVIREYGIHGPRPVRLAPHAGLRRQQLDGHHHHPAPWAASTGSIDIEGWHDPVYRDELEMTGQVRGLNYLKDCRGGSFVPKSDLSSCEPAGNLLGCTDAGTC